MLNVVALTLQKVIFKSYKMSKHWFCFKLESYKTSFDIFVGNCDLEYHFPTQILSMGFEFLSGNNLYKLLAFVSMFP